MHEQRTGGVSGAREPSGRNGIDDERVRGVCFGGVDRVVGGAVDDDM